MIVLGNTVMYVQTRLYDTGVRKQVGNERLIH
jgi:hypothetical protein